MSKAQEHKLKLQHKRASEWIGDLEPRKVRALAHQHGFVSALYGDIEYLRTQLMLVPEVGKIAEEMSKRDT